MEDCPEPNLDEPEKKYFCHCVAFFSFLKDPGWPEGEYGYPDDSAGCGPGSHIPWLTKIFSPPPTQRHIKSISLHHLPSNQDMLHSQKIQHSVYPASASNPRLPASPGSFVTIPSTPISWSLFICPGVSAVHTNTRLDAACASKTASAVTASTAIP